MRQCPDRSEAFLDEATRATILIVALQRIGMMITRHAAGDRPLPRVTGHRVASGSTCSPLGINRRAARSAAPAYCSRP